MKLTQAQKKEARKGDLVKVSSGVWLASSERMMSDQKEWADEDESKEMDFSKSDFWLTTDDGIVEAI